MANPRKADWDKLVRLAKYLKGKPRYVIMYVPQKDVYCINGFGDSDFAASSRTSCLRLITKAAAIHLCTYLVPFPLAHNPCIDELGPSDTVKTNRIHYLLHAH